MRTASLAVLYLVLHKFMAPPENYALLTSILSQHSRTDTHITSHLICLAGNIPPFQASAQHQSLWQHGKSIFANISVSLLFLGQSDHV